MSSGYASFDYSTADPEPADLVKVDISINGESVDALSFVCHRDAAQRKGRDVAKRLKEVRRALCVLFSGGMCLKAAELCRRVKKMLVSVRELRLPAGVRACGRVCGRALSQLAIDHAKGWPTG